MKKKALLLGFAGSMIGFSSCSEHGNAPVVQSSVGRITNVDSLNDKVLIDTTPRAITRPVPWKAHIQITGLFSNNVSPKKGDVLLFTLDTTVSPNESNQRIETFRLIPYSLN